MDVRHVEQTFDAAEPVDAVHGRALLGPNEERALGPLVDRGGRDLLGRGEGAQYSHGVVGCEGGKTS